MRGQTTCLCESRTSHRSSDTDWQLFPGPEPPRHCVVLPAARTPAQRRESRVASHGSRVTLFLSARTTAVPAPRQRKLSWPGPDARGEAAWRPRSSPRGRPRTPRKTSTVYASETQIPGGKDCTHSNTRALRRLAARTVRFHPRTGAQPKQKDGGPRGRALVPNACISSAKGNA